MARKIRLVRTHGDGTAIVQDLGDGAYYLCLSYDVHDANKTMESGRIIRIPATMVNQLRDGETRRVAMRAWAKTNFTRDPEWEWHHQQNEDQRRVAQRVYRVWDKLRSTWVRSNSGRTVWFTPEHAERVIRYRNDSEYEIVEFDLVPAEA